MHPDLLYLEQHGIVASRPPIRSRDFGMALFSPFDYLLQRRFRIKDDLRSSDALTCGTWMHSAYESHTLPAEQRELFIERLWELRKKEIREACDRSSIPDPRPFYEHEEQLKLKSVAWLQAFMASPTDNGQTYEERFVTNPDLIVLGREVEILYKHPLGPLLIQPDTLIYDQRRNRIYFDDLKSTSEPIHIRLARFPFEFQPIHYLFSLYRLIESGFIQSEYNLPSDVTLGGMRHLVFRKPSIKFCNKDRDYHEKEHTLLSGKRKGQVEIRREYHGEPLISNYIERCRDWITGSGEYSEEPRDGADAATGWSVTQPQQIDFDYYENELLPRVARLRNCEARPNNFPRNSQEVDPEVGGRENPFWALYTKSPRAWPQILNSTSLIQEEPAH